MAVVPSDGEIVWAIGGWAEAVVSDGELVGYAPLRPEDAAPPERCGECGRPLHGTGGNKPMPAVDGGGDDG